MVKGSPRLSVATRETISQVVPRATENQTRLSLIVASGDLLTELAEFRPGEVIVGGETLAATW